MRAGNNYTICRNEELTEAKTPGTVITKQQKGFYCTYTNEMSNLNGNFAVCVSPLGFVVCFCVFVRTNPQSPSIIPNLNVLQ